MNVSIPSAERFIKPAPQRVDQNHLLTLKNAGARNSIIALEIQQRAHELFAHPGYYEKLRRWPRTNIQSLRGMAFEGLYPLPEDLKALNLSLRNKLGPIQNEVRKFIKQIVECIEGQEEFWDNTPWKNGERAMHQDLETISRLVKTHSGRLGFFGSARLEEGTNEYDSARWLSKTLVEHLANDDGTSEEVVTGAGPGIMAAGNQGALEGSWNQLKSLLEEYEENPAERERIELAIMLHRSRMQSIGVRIELPFETGWNPHLHLNLSLPKFPARKEALMSLVSGEFGPNGELPDHQWRHPAFFNFKGGIGTRDEIWEVICLQQCKKMPPTPIFIVGETERRMIESSMQAMLQDGTICPQDPTLRIGGKDHLIFCNDEVEAALKYVEWYGINPPPSFDEEITKRQHSIRNRADETFDDYDSGLSIRVSA